MPNLEWPVYDFVFNSCKEYIRKLLDRPASSLCLLVKTYGTLRILPLDSILGFHKQKLDNENNSLGRIKL
jgi:hypothetical protein